MFPSGDWKLPTNAPLLDKMVPTLSKLRTTKIVVRGYTDNTPIGQPLQAAGVTDNLDLSARRAMSVVRYLVAHSVDLNILRPKRSVRPTRWHQTTHQMEWRRTVALKSC